MKKILALVAVVSVFAGSAAFAAEKAAGGAKAPAAKAKSLYERLGGLPAIAMVTDEFLNKLGADPVVTANKAVADAASKPGAMPYLKFQITNQLCQVTGGPCKYGGKSMKEAHKSLGITEAEWNAAVADLTAVLDSHNVPQKEKDDLFKILGTTKKDIVTGGAGTASTAAAPAH